MATVWYFILALMLTAYVVLDGFDLGAGILHLFVAKTDDERRTVIGAIGPIWDGNEVWLIASGGLSVFTFPRAYAAGFSGFYLPLMMVLWLLVMRGLSIEFRSREANHLWRSFWDGGFAVSSTLLALVFGAALGNVLRGVPLDATGYFAGPLFTNFRVVAHPGVLDWYTILIGLYALFTLAGHGAHYLIWKTEGPVQERCRSLAPRLWGAVIAFWILSTWATAAVQPAIFHHLQSRPWAWMLGLLMLAAIGAIYNGLAHRRERTPFLGSACYILAMLGVTAAGVYPNILISTLNPQYTLSVFNAANSEASLRIALWVWLPAILLAIGYFIYLFYSFRHKVHLDEDGYGH